MQYQTRSTDAGRLAGPGLLMSSAWLRLAGALLLIGLLWVAVGWALAEVPAVGA